MNQFTPEELKNLLALINLASIKGQEAITVALLQQKINNLLTQIPSQIPTNEETKTNQ